MSSLTVSRTFTAQPERLWAAFTTHELAAWFWPPRFETMVTIDPRVDGAYRVASAPVGMAVSGTFSVVVAPSRLVYSWRWDGEDDETEVTIEFDNSTVTITHRGFSTDETRDDHIQGWNDCLDRLARVIEPVETALPD